jgi:hypothetical protein
MRVRSKPGRPIHGFSRSLDAACLFRELRRQGLTWRESTDAIHGLLGVSKTAVEKYLNHPITPMNDESDRTYALYVVAKHWRAFVGPKLPSLTNKAQRAVLEIRSRQKNHVPQPQSA